MRRALAKDATPNAERRQALAAMSNCTTADVDKYLYELRLRKLLRADASAKRPAAGDTICSPGVVEAVAQLLLQLKAHATINGKMTTANLKYWLTLVNRATAGCKRELILRVYGCRKELVETCGVLTITEQPLVDSDNDEEDNIVCAACGLGE